MGIVSKAGMLITAAFKGFDKAKSQFSKITDAAKFAGKAALGGDPVTNAAKPISAQSRAIESNIAKMSKLNKISATTGKLAGNTNTFLAALAGVGAFFGIDKIVNGLDKMLDGLIEGQREASKFGLSFSGLQAHNFEMKQLGINAEDSLTGLTKIYDLQNKARIGDITASRIMGRTKDQAKFDPKSIQEVIIGDDAKKYFDNFQQEMKGVGTHAERAGRLLMVLGEDAYKLSPAFAEMFDIQEKAGKQSKLFFGDFKDMNGDVKRLGDAVDRVHLASINFNSALSQFKNVSLEIGAEYLSFYGSMIQRAIDKGAENGVSVRTLALDAMSLVANGFAKAANLGMRIVQLLEQSLEVAKSVANELPGINLDLGKGDLSDRLKRIEGVWDKRMFPEDMNFAKMIGNGVGAFGLNQTDARAKNADMKRLEPLVQQANPIIENNKSDFEEINESLKRVTLLKPLLPKDIFAREIGSILSRAESKTGYLQLQLPSANRAFSVDTESLISRINMERETKGREPLERLILGVNQLKEIQDQQLKALESLLNLSRQDIDKMIWGK